jgi:glycosyltransferase involved in cell wall biosynthesis
MKELVSVVIRTLNEEKHLEELLSTIQEQQSECFKVESVIVDSGSTDNTLEIAKKYGCRITYIKKEEFTFGRSLNVGCDYADGKYLVFVSGHCIPASKTWLHDLVLPLKQQGVAYTYGKQVGRDTTKFSERQLFDKYFPDENSIPQEGFFCNNANSAIRKDVWKQYQFDEHLTGCEDMYLAKKIVNDGLKLGYVGTAPVYHIHDESWTKVGIRYEREAIALQKIMPEVHVNFFDMLRYITIGIIKDSRNALKKGVFTKEIFSICAFRYVQYVGAYKGNHIHRKLSKEMKMKYFYPRVSNMNINSHLSDKD